MPGKISEMPLISTLSGAELIEIVQGGVNKAMTPKQLLASTLNPFPVRFNILYGIGDSMTAYNAGPSNPTGIEWGLRTWMTHVMGMSKGQLVWGRNAGIGGEDGPTIVNRLNKDVLIYPRGICVIMIGTNGFGSSTLDIEFRKAIDACLGAGFIAVACAIPPAGTSGGASDRLTARAAIKAIVDSYVRQDVIFADTVASAGYLTGPNAGNWADPSYTYDGLHPLPIGAQKLGEGIWNAIRDSGVLAGLRNFRQASASDSLNLVSNSYFTDAFSSGRPSGWGVGFGNLTCAAVDPIAGETLKGKWLEITSPNGNGVSIIGGPSIDLSPYYGQRVLIKYRMKWSGVSQANSGGFFVNAPGLRHYVAEGEMDFAEYEFSTIFTAMPNSQDASISVFTYGNSTGSNNVKCYIGEPGVFPLEAAKFPKIPYERVSTFLAHFGAYTPLPNDRYVIAECTFADGTINLPDVAANIGRIITCIKYGSGNNMILDPSGSQQIYDENGGANTKSYGTAGTSRTFVAARGGDNSLYWQRIA